jgi:hypothetical protein
VTLRQTLTEDPPPYRRDQGWHWLRANRYAAENGPLFLLVGGGMPVRGLAEKAVAVGCCFRVLETITCPHAVPFKATWSCKSMPELVPGSGEGQNQIKEPLRRSGKDGQSSRWAADKRQSMTEDAGRIRSILRHGHALCSKQGAPVRNRAHPSPPYQAVKNLFILKASRFLSMK